jgi:hypothetical protein
MTSPVRASSSGEKLIPERLWNADTFAEMHRCIAVAACEE